MPCQDAYGTWSASLAGTPCHILAVSDGHGSDEYHHSQFGSFLAIRAAYEEFVQFFQWYALLKTGPAVPEGLQPAGLERDFKAVFARRVVRRWRDNVKAFSKDVLRCDTDSGDSGDNVFRPFGCTLLAAMLTRDRAFLLQIGDGGIFLRREDGEVVSLADDDDEPGEATDSLASGDPEKVAIASVVSLDDVSAVMLATDGLTKSFTKADTESVPKGIQKTMSWLVDRVVKDKLDVEGHIFEGFLDNCSKGGTGDDVTVTLAFSRAKLLAGERKPPEPPIERDGSEATTGSAASKGGQPSLRDDDSAGSSGPTRDAEMPPTSKSCESGDEVDSDSSSGEHLPKSAGEVF
ncbi:MAG: protein phosphatase 2C domain-containing protein [Akkermansiaceae bacterium]|nr:protein phosphatase 2C domain-containing protein [Akkermansiaceae bacterium]